MILPGEINPLLLALGSDGASGTDPEHSDPVVIGRRRLNGPILIIEDDAAIRDTLAEILEYEGFRVVAIASGEAALQQLQAGLRPGLILLDLTMPEVNGWGIAGQLRRIPALAGVPVVVISGVHDVEQQAAALGVDGCLLKPVEVERLLEIISRFCHTA